GRRAVASGARRGGPAPVHPVRPRTSRRTPSSGRSRLPARRRTSDRAGCRSRAV
ncbi:MAG: hypothetical protein AVDCRST_MAG36-1047, partial [uncultured Nocardioidaceae bacterium]